MKSLRWVGLVFSLLIVGVLGGLMAPLPSEALPPTLTIDGASATVANGGLLLADPNDAQRVTKWPACWKLVNNVPTRVDTGFNFCYVVAGTGFGTTKTFGTWTVGSVASGNQFRVLANDTNAVGATDDLKASGGTFRPTNTGAGVEKTASAFLEIAFSNPTGDWKWAMGAGMTITPPATENIQGDDMRLIGTAFFANAPATAVSIGADIAIVTFPKTNGQPGSVSRRNPTFTKTGCSTGGSKCDVTVRYEYRMKFIGFDVGRTDDSWYACGGTCISGEPATNKLANCVDLVKMCDDKIAGNELIDIEEGKKTGAVVAVTCTVDATKSCITIILDATPDNDATDKEFVLEAILQDAQGDPLPPILITLTADSFGTAGTAFSPLDEDLNSEVGEWKFNIVGYPVSKTGTWQADQWSCVSKLLNSTLTYTVDTQPNGVKGPLRVLTLAAGDIATCEAHVHRESKKK